MKRGFWVALGLGAGATGAVIASRWTKKQARRVAPQSIAREAKGGLLDLGKLFNESLAEGKRAMDEREAQLRRDYGVEPEASTAGVDRGPDADDPAA